MCPHLPLPDPLSSSLPVLYLVYHHDFLSFRPEPRTHNFTYPLPGSGRLREPPSHVDDPEESTEDDTLGHQFDVIIRESFPDGSWYLRRHQLLKPYECRLRVSSPTE